MTTTKIYKNTNKKGSGKVNLLGVAELAPGEQVSVTAEYHTPVNLQNYPGVVELVEEERLADEAEGSKK